MLTTIANNGLIAQKAWNGNRNVAFAALCVLICVLKKPLNMLMSMASLYLPAVLVFLAGKTWSKINGCGHRAAEKYDDVIYWDYNWRKAGGSQRMIEISKRERFYQQEYCGCVYSLRDSNKWREETGRQKIEIGKLYYTPD